MQHFAFAGQLGELLAQERVHFFIGKLFIFSEGFNYCFGSIQKLNAIFNVVNGLNFVGVLFCHYDIL